MTVANEEAARRMLFGTGAGDHAQALVYVLRYVQRFDASTLADFRTLSAACGMTGVNTLAVLSQVDRRGDEEDPWPSARRLAARAYEQLRTSVFDVVPVVGLLAEAARAEVLGAAELDGLRALAALDEWDLDDLLLDVEQFATAPDYPVPVRVRRSLVARLHRYGIRVATSALRERDLDLDGLRGVLLAASGFAGRDGAGSVASGISHFTHRAEQLKALAAINRLRGLVRAPASEADRPVLAALAATLDDGQPISGSLAGLRVVAAVDAVGRGQLTLDEQMLGELLRLARNDDPAAQLGLEPGAPAGAAAAAAGEATIRWRQLAVTAGTAVAGQRARDVLGVFEGLATGRPASTVPAARTPAVKPRSALPVTGDVRRLLDSPVVPAADQVALRALLTGVDLAGQVGAPPDAEPGAVARAAAAHVARFRALLHRPLPAADRRAVTAVCDVYEAIWSAADSWEETADVHRG
ncbi:hypothetical protein Pflav_033500 [Phytohabitans flavus]|uniref:Uncharacterized protein n=1 Tax=Phytohabitans flavus TaxID=1076124 RepID=A0A6F8XSZ3_9ACTN|nr:hypothetical protein [Phytohabitans flavus]BCB76940.1 hypothetical protein Pflav_033500 [Phytohabitans flavus]